MVHDTYSAGRYLVGVRWSEPGFDVRLRDALRPHVVDAPSPPNLNVVVGGGANAALRPKHHLYLASGASISSVSPGRLLVALVRQLDDIARWGTEHGWLRIRATVLIDGAGRCVLVDDRLRPELESIPIDVRRLGLRMVDVPAACVDDVAGEVVVTAPMLGLDLPLEVLGTEGPPDRHALVDPPSRLAIDRVIVAGGVSSRAEDVAANGVAMAAVPPTGAVTSELAARTARWLAAADARLVPAYSGGLAAALR